MTIGERIKLLRTEKGYDQQNLCAYLNIEQSTLSNYENDRRIPKAELIVKLANYFNVSTDYLLGKTDLKNYDHYKPILTERDEKDILKDLEKMMDDLDSGQSGPTYYGGELELSEYDREILKGSLEQALRIIKLKNKETYTPNIHRKN